VAVVDPLEAEGRLPLAAGKLEGVADEQAAATSTRTIVGLTQAGLSFFAPQRLTTP
jgi:hypothetical protein